MIRPNLAMDPPPEVLAIEGGEVSVKTDYRVWLQALPLLRRLPEGEAYRELTALLFDGDIEERPDAVIKAIAGFLKGYPCQADWRDVGMPFDLEADINEIVIAIRRRSGLDLSYRREAPFHWWLFLLEAKALAWERYVPGPAAARGAVDDG